MRGHEASDDEPVYPEERTSWSSEDPAQGLVNTNTDLVLILGKLRSITPNLSIQWFIYVFVH